MASHDACTHEKTKSGRAACRKSQGLIGDRKTANDLPPMSAQEKLRVKSGKAARKTRKRSGTDEGDSPSPAQRIRDIGPFRGLFASGLCGEGHHGRCTGQYTLTPCSCPCHKIAAEDAD